MSGKLRLFCTHQDRPHENLSKTTIYLSNLDLSFLLSGCPDKKKKKGSASSKSVYGTPTSKPGKPTSIKP